VEFEALWMWDWVGHSYYGHDKENSNALTGSQTLVIQSVADYFNDSYQTDKVNNCIPIIHMPDRALQEAYAISELL
jgi:hypothetical protein